MEKGISKWIFTLSLSFVLMLVEYVFSAYMLPNEKTVIFLSATVNFLVYLFFVIKNEIESKDKKTVVFLSFLLSFIACVFFVKSVWFSGYLCLNPLNRLFEGNFHADTLSHSALAESIISNGYPSLLFDTKEMFHYHFGSHYVMALISKILNIHAFSAYNYIYPVLFLPLFFLLFFTAIEKIVDRKITFKEVFFIVFICFIGFMPQSFEEGAGLFYKSIFVSESFCMGLTLMFLFIILLNEKNVFSLKNVILAFVFIFACAFMKISIGILIWCFCGWYTIRGKGVVKTIPYAIILTIPLGISFLLFNEKVGSASSHQIVLLHYFRRYVARDALLCFVFLFLWPAAFGLAIKFAGKNLITEIKLKNILLEESMLITTAISLLPAMFLYIEGGSAFYFFGVMYQIFIIYFVAVGGVNKIIYVLKRNHIVTSFLITVFLGSSAFNCLYAFGSIYKNRPSLHGNVSAIYDNEVFKELETISSKTRNERKTSGVLITKDSKIFELYAGKNLRSLSYFVQAYTGLPVYGMYEQKDGNVVLINGEFVQKDIKPLYFGLDYDKVFSGKSVEEKMKDDGIETVINLK